MLKSYVCGVGGVGGVVAQYIKFWVRSQELSRFQLKSKGDYKKHFNQPTAHSSKLIQSLFEHEKEIVEPLWGIFYRPEHLVTP